MRLIDYLHTLSDSWEQSNPVVFVADTVAMQIDQIDLPNEFTPPADWYGCVAPPFRLFWVESMTYYKSIPMHRGVLFEDVTGYAKEDDLIPPVMVPLRDAAKWVLHVHSWVWVNKDKLYSYPCRAVLHVGNDGLLLDDMTNIHIAIEDGRLLSDPHYLPPEEMTKNLPFALKAIGLLHQRTEVEYYTPNSAQRRRHRKETGKELRNYYTLKIHPLSSSKRLVSLSEACLPVSSQGKRAHEVRSHFRYYSKERPLFGKISGMIWIPAHTRGAEEDGEIVKRYEIIGNQKE